jgi:hypothetical protein
MGRPTEMPAPPLPGRGQENGSTLQPARGKWRSKALV